MAGFSFHSDPAGLQVGVPIIGQNSQQFSNGDPVCTDTSGWLTVAGAGDLILGYYIGPGKTMTSDNQTVAKFKPSYVYANMVVMRCASTAALVQSDVGEWVDISTTTTGAQVVGVPSATSAQFFVLAIDDEADGTNDVALLVASELQHNAAGNTTAPTGL